MLFQSRSVALLLWLLFVSSIASASDRWVRLGPLGGPVLGPLGGPVFYVEVDPNRPSRMYAGGHRLYMTIDSGVSWATLPSPFASGADIGPLAVSSSSLFLGVDVLVVTPPFGYVVTDSALLRTRDN